MIIFDPQRGEYIDTETGEVIEERVVDLGPEWRVSNNDDISERERTGYPLTPKVHDGGISTKIGITKFRNAEDKIKLIKMRRLQKSIRVSHKDRKLVTLLSMLDREASRLRLPEYVKETAGIILRKLVKDDSVKRIKPSALAAVVLYYSCQVNNIPIHLQELRARFGVSERALWKAIRRVNEVMPDLRPKTLTPTKYIPVILDKLNLPLTVGTKATEIVDFVYKKGLASGKSHISYSAAAVYLVSKLTDNNKTLKEISGALNISELPIRKRLKEMLRILGPIRYTCKNCGYELYKYERVGQDVHGIRTPSEVKLWYSGKCPRCGHELGEPSLVPGKLEVVL